MPGVARSKNGYSFETGNMFVLAIELLLDSGELGLDGVFFFLNGCDFLIELVLSLLALLQLVLDVA